MQDIKFNGLENAFYKLRSGSFYENVNEFNLNFAIFFISLVTTQDPDAPHRPLQLYSLLSSYLYANKYGLTVDCDDEAYQARIEYYLYPTSGMQHNGLIAINTNISNNAYASSMTFKASIKVQEFLNEEYLNDLNHKNIQGNEEYLNDLKHKNIQERD
ncbi:hypothetical protein CR532_05240 (plasmid) [Candidatus Borreliella tachyglossi]|uniref:Uncharacterized protein n=1 Tax=Candidatus Borreliella tachyglossi TaxID=1964448 RepID=A0A2S1LYG6_9SPIR|nr:DUF764 family protein [Candidatus Borreliella tachyglossi]AWG43357.1 hypothetical protein CR532_04990 [Candidatus Borreliella tachyglossi]AWG43400.1 hypothetical protein CR532_05240 [Candidatus Borreliella tachyglossi]